MNFNEEQILKLVHQRYNKSSEVEILPHFETFNGTFTDEFEDAYRSNNLITFTGSESSLEKQPFDLINKKRSHTLRVEYDREVDQFLEIGHDEDNCFPSWKIRFGVNGLNNNLLTKDKLEQFLNEQKDIVSASVTVDKANPALWIIDFNITSFSSSHLPIDYTKGTGGLLYTEIDLGFVNNCRIQNFNNALFYGELKVYHESSSLNAKFTLYDFHFSESRVFDRSLRPLANSHIEENVYKGFLTNFHFKNPSTSEIYFNVVFNGFQLNFK